MEKLKISIVQFKRRLILDENLWTAISLVRKIKGYGTLAFSENWLSSKPIDISIYSYYVEKIGNILDTNVLGGIQYVYENEIIKSVGLAYIDRKLIRSCEKINPSKAVGERNLISEGNYIKPLKINDWNIGCLACVDIFYPELSRMHALNKADVIYNPASISSDSLNLWHSVLQTRAAENLVYSIGVNNTDTIYPDGRITNGGSTIFNPHGDKIAELGSNDLILTVDLDYGFFDYIYKRWAFKQDLFNKYFKLYSNFMG